MALAIGLYKLVRSEHKIWKEDKSRRLSITGSIIKSWSGIIISAIISIALFLKYFDLL